MQIIIAENEEKWNGWLRQNYSHNPFAQSWDWGEVLISEGKKVERLGVVEGGTILALAQVVYGDLPFGWRHVFCPMGPVLDNNINAETENQIYKLLIDHFREENCIFFRTESARALPKKLVPLVKKTIDINPPATVILDLNKSADEMLASMHQKTRYNIRLAEKKDIVIDNGKNFSVFWNLMKKTGARDGFKLHREEHYKNLFNYDSAGQTTAYLNHKAIACIVYYVFGNTFTYLYGASDYHYRNLMAPYLLQWHCIQLAKHSGYEYYDFFGVAPKVNSNSPDYQYDDGHQYAGVTRFKLGFGGESCRRAGTRDIVISGGKYKFYKFLRAIRRLF
jgi:peptidoglycan pentaglycine glycine transferase (the first glycine)